MSFSHRHRFRVIYGDTDMAGVVYYGNYLRYFEAGRAELLRAAGLVYREIQARGVTLPVIEAQVSYRSPARYDDELELETIVEEVKQVSLRIRYRLVRPADDALIATGETRHASVGGDGRPTRLPAEIRSRLHPERRDV
jgi:acyl-CoA thioester hydrolase